LPPRDTRRFAGIASAKRRSSISDRELCGSRAAESVPRKPAASRISCFRASNRIAVLPRFSSSTSCPPSVLVTSAFVSRFPAPRTRKPIYGEDGAATRCSRSSSSVGISTIPPEGLTDVRPSANVEQRRRGAHYFSFFFPGCVLSNWTPLDFRSETFSRSYLLSLQPTLVDSTSSRTNQIR